MTEFVVFALGFVAGTITGAIIMVLHGGGKEDE